MPKLPGFRWLYHQEGKHLQRVLPLLTCMKSWATAACESTLTLHYLSPIPPVPMISRYCILHRRVLSSNFRSKLGRNAVRLNSSTTALVFSCFLHQLFKIISILSSKMNWQNEPLAALHVDLRHLPAALYILVAASMDLSVLWLPNHDPL